MTWHDDHKQELTRGERAADIMRNGLGSWGFIFGFIGFMALWMGLNMVAWFVHWDEPPFILLNLGLSTLAGLQGGILLIAAKRQDAIASAMAQHDYDTNVSAAAEIKELHKILLNQHKILEELRAK